MADLDIYKQTEVAIKNAHGIYLDHETRLAKATAATRDLLEKAQKGMDEEIYSQSVNLLGKLKATVKKFNEDRKPVTSAIQALVKAFTSQENALDISKPETDAYKLKMLMDKYAAQKEAERKAKEEEERRRIEREREIATIQVSAMAFLEKVCAKAISERKSEILALTNSLDLDNYESIRKELLAFDTRIPESLFGEFDVEIKAIYLTKAEKKNVLDLVMNLDEWADMQDEYTKELGIFLHEKIAELPTIKKELEEIAAADFKRAEELKKEKIKRDEQEAARVASEREIAENAAKEKELEQTRKAAIQAEFEFGASKAEISSGVKVKNSYRIELRMPMGLLEVTQFWCSNQEWPMEEKKVMTVSFERMVKFAENEASRNEHFIKSDYVKYIPIVESKI